VSGAGARARLAVLAAVLIAGGVSCDDDPVMPPGRAGSPTASPAPSPVAGGRVTVGVLGSPATLDPYSPVASDLTYQLVRPVYPSLFRLVPDDEGLLLPEPYLAETLEPAPGGVRITLKPMQWSNGRPITARDVLASIRRASSISGFASVTSARAAAPNVVVLKGKLRAWQTALATLAFVMPNGRATKIGGGPFAIRSYTPGLQVVYEPNPNWQGEGPYLDRATVQFILSVELMFGLVRTERLDMIVPPSAVNLGDRLDALGLEHSSEIGFETLYLDLEGAPWTPAQAARIAASLDVRAMAAGLIRDDGRRADHLDPAPSAPSARRLLNSSGRATTSDTIQMAGPVGDELIELVQKVAQVHLTKRDYEVELLTIDPETYYGRWALDDPMDIAVRRLVGGPGLRFPDSIFRQADAIPLFFVASYVAWQEGIFGPRANPSHDGPLWNMDQWFRVDQEA
jgi:Bacterial extracellular solute-binding proteins, family 5 Middle